MARSLKLSANTIKASLDAHSSLGLFISALLYLVCITGLVCIYYPDFERWEQANVTEFTEVQPVQVQAALEKLLAHHRTEHLNAKPFEDVWVGLPTNDMPRFSVGGKVDEIETQFYVNADGSLGEKVNHEWTHFITKLHYSLTVPGIWGLTLVGVIGVILVSLVISGILAHPTIFKNAFSLRVNRGQRQQQVDMHNRIGVWSTPFILVIAITGSLIGLSQIFLFAFSTGFFEGDITTITNELYMPHPEPTNIAAPFMNTAPVLEKFATENPQLLPYYFSIHYPETTAQTLELGAYIPDRLVWYDAFQFNADGEQIKRLGWPDGDAGLQIYASTYRLHFGHFGGLPVKIIYTLLGLGMCFMCATGMNIWFRRQQQAGTPHSRLECTWLGVIWGFPSAVILTAITDFWWQDYSVATFWLVSLIFIGSATFIHQRDKVSILLRTVMACLIITLLIIHLTFFGRNSFNSASALLNSLLLLAFFSVTIPLIFQRVKSTGLQEAHSSG